LGRMAEDDETLRFCLSREGTSNGAQGAKSFTLKVGAETPIRIGRAPGNDMIVESRGVSQYHAELRLLRLDGEVVPRLCVRDLSMNGTGLKRPDGKAPLHLDKRADVPLQDGSVLLVPMLLKVSQAASDRGWLRVEFEGSSKAGDADARRAAVASAPVPQAQAVATPAGGANGRGADAAGDDVEGCRMRFVELLLKTREVSAGTTYEEAKKLLSTSPDWHAVDESTRKECFDIFVEHLGSHQSQKKKEKKKGKEKDKDKSKKQKHREEEEPQAPKEQRYGRSPEKTQHQGDEKKRRDRRGGGSRSGSPDRKRKREKKASRRSRSRPGRSASGGGGSVPRSKRRHRDRSGGSP